ncbi:Sir2 family NAD-dependent protein deacetylase [Methylomonas sp. CM2]|uniref:Sir2 family NAD-dependent protein deacetylase n=1 Tax=Methylomonas sp. CM2 TaxID=3417647 RepID=UPI003CEF3D6D
MFNDRLIQSLRDAQHLVILTGAGVSAESGIPTFRDAMTGLWARYDPQQLASENGFRANPALVWGWYEWRRAKVFNDLMRSGQYDGKNHFSGVKQIKASEPKTVFLSTDEIKKLFSYLGACRT